MLLFNVDFSGKEKLVGGGFSFRIEDINLSGRSRYRFFYCSKNRKNLLFPRQQWKVGVVSLP